jgi:hypothetical protein
MLIVGHGGPAGTRDPVRPEVVLRMRARGLTLEVLTTEQAISTYNFLAEEGRVVAAALIPPDEVLIKDEDVVHTKERYRNLLSNPDNSMIGMRRSDYKDDKEL